MVHVISAYSRQKTRSFPASWHANMFVEASICRLVVCVNQTGSFHFSQAKLVLEADLRMSSIFSRNKLMIPIVLSQSLCMFFWWLVFTSNLNSQTTWLKVKLKLVNLKLVKVRQNIHMLLTPPSVAHDCARACMLKCTHARAHTHARVLECMHVRAHPHTNLVELRDNTHRDLAWRLTLPCNFLSGTNVAISFQRWTIF